MRASGNISATSAGRDLLHVDAAVAVERRHPPVLLEPILVGGELDEADRLEPGGQTGLGLEAGVQVTRVLAHLGRGLRRRSERHHQPGRVPRGARRELVALDEHDVAPAQVRQVVRDRATDDTTADHDDPGPRGQFGHCGIIPCHGKSTPNPVLSASDAAHGPNLKQTGRGVRSETWTRRRSGGCTRPCRRSSWRPATRW